MLDEPYGLEEEYQNHTPRLWLALAPSEKLNKTYNMIIFMVVLYLDTTTPARKGLRNLVRWLACQAVALAKAEPRFKISEAVVR